MTRLPAILSAVCLLVTAGACPARPLIVADEAEGVGACNQIVADVLRWTPALGAPAAFIADQYAARSDNALIVLGADEAGIWTAEIESRTDACNDCSSLSLVHTAYDGKRTAHLVGTGPDAAERPAPQKSERQAMLRRLFSLAAGPWRATELAQDYSLALVPHDVSGTLLRRYTGWFAEVRVPGKPAVRFGVRWEPIACWCSHYWHGYPLAAPVAK